MNSLLVLHIVFGNVSLITSFLALLTKKGSLNHKKVGRYFFYAMIGLFFTAIPLALIKSNTVLLIIALFSFYWAFTGWRYAKRVGSARWFDWLITLGMIAVSAIMVIKSLWPLDFNHSNSIAILVFGVAGIFFSLNDAWLYYRDNISYQTRIIKHLGGMLGGTIAVYTAFAVTNLKSLPSFLVWLGPTIIFIPLIQYWTNKVKTHLP